MLDKKYTITKNEITIGDKPYKIATCRTFAGYALEGSKVCYYVPALYKGIKNAYDLLIDCYGKEKVKDRAELRKIAVLGPGFESLDSLRYAAKNHTAAFEDVHGSLDGGITIFSNGGRIFACTIDDIYTNDYTKDYSHKLTEAAIGEGTDFSDYELYQILEQNGYKTHKKNLQLLKEGVTNGRYAIAETSLSESLSRVPTEKLKKKLSKLHGKQSYYLAKRDYKFTNYKLAGLFGDPLQSEAGAKKYERKFDKADNKIDKLEDELIKKEFDRVYKKLSSQNPVLVRSNGTEKRFNDVFDNPSAKDTKMSILALELPGLDDYKTIWKIK